MPILNFARLTLHFIRLYYKFKYEMILHKLRFFNLHAYLKTRNVFIAYPFLFTICLYPHANGKEYLFQKVFIKSTLCGDITKETKSLGKKINNFYVCCTHTNKLHILSTSFLHALLNLLASRYKKTLDFSVKSQIF